MLAFIFDSVGFGEWFILLAVVLIVVGPQKLPSTARKLGNFYAKLRRAADSFKRQLMDMETEFDKAANEVTSGVDEAFKLPQDDAPENPEGSESKDDPGTPDSSEFQDNPDETEYMDPTYGMDEPDSPETPDAPDNPETPENPNNPENPAAAAPGDKTDGDIADKKP
jgi:Tat protein translocase TatB subunit